MTIGIYFPVDKFSKDTFISITISQIKVAFLQDVNYLFTRVAKSAKKLHV